MKNAGHETTLEEKHLKDFLDIAEEYVQSIEENLLELERHPNNKELIHEIFRSIHSIKGDAGMVGLEEINRFAHEMENVFDLVREDKLRVTSNLMDLMFESTKILRLLLDQVHQNDDSDVNTAPTVGKLKNYEDGDQDSEEELREIQPSEEIEKTTGETDKKIEFDLVDENEYVIFKLSDMICAIPVMSTQEVVDDLPCTRVPRVEEFIDGVINLRGNIVPVVNLRSRLLIEDEDFENQQILIIIQNENKIGLKVDEVFSVEYLDKDLMYKPENFPINLDSTFVNGVIEKNGNLILIMELTKLLQREDLTINSTL